MNKDKELELLKSFKKRSGWSYDRLSKEMGVHHQTVQSWFVGKYRPGNLARKVINEFIEKQKGG